VRSFFMSPRRGTRRWSEKILQQEWVHHPVLGIDAPPHALEEVEPAAEHLGGVFGRQPARLVEEGHAAPVLRELAKVNGEVLPPPRLCGHGSQYEHRFVERWR